MSVLDRMFEECVRLRKERDQAYREAFAYEWTERPPHVDREYWDLCKAGAKSVVEKAGIASVMAWERYSIEMNRRQACETVRSIKRRSHQKRP